MERLSESSKGGRVGDDFNNSTDRSEVKKDDFESYLEDFAENSDENGVDVNFRKIDDKLNEAAEYLNTEGRDASFSRSSDANLIPEKLGDHDFHGVSSSPSDIERDDGHFSEPKNIPSLKEQSSKVCFEELKNLG